MLRIYLELSSVWEKGEYTFYMPKLKRNFVGWLFRYNGPEPDGDTNDIGKDESCTFQEGEVIF